MLSLLTFRAKEETRTFYYALRTCPPQFFIEAPAQFDAALRKALDNIVTSEGPGFGDLQWRLVTLPIRVGGLGVYATYDAGLYAFLASRMQSIKLQNHILRECDEVSIGKCFALAQDALQLKLTDVDFEKLTTKGSVPLKLMHYLADLYFSSICKNLHTVFNFSERQTGIFKCFGAKHAQDFLLATPIEGLGQCMTPTEYQMVLRYRIMIPLFSEGAHCPLCLSRMDIFGEHIVHYQKYSGFKYRHDMIKDVLYDILWRAGISAKKEVPVNFLTPLGEVRSTLIPVDVLVYSWNGGKHICVDLTGVSPLSGFDNRVFIVGQAVTRTTEAKVNKHDKACKDNQHNFMPFTFDIFGFLASNDVEFLRRVQKIMTNNVITVYSTEYVFQRIGFVIQQGLAAQLVARLPRTFVT